MRAVEGAETLTLSPKHLADLRSSGLDDATIDAAGLYTEPNQERLSEFLGRSWRRGPALVFPFLDYETGAIVMRRIKPDRPRTRQKNNKTKPIKYEQAAGTGAQPYFGPGTLKNRRLETHGTILVTEGEKKTLLLDMLGFAVLGLTGVHNFNDGEANRLGDGIQWSKAIAPLAQKYFREKKFVFVPDSDFETNPDVQRAILRCAGLALSTGARAAELVVIPGGHEGVGIDDYFHAHGSEATLTLIDTALAIEYGGELAPIPPKDPLERFARFRQLKSANLAGDLRVPLGYAVRRDLSLYKASETNPDAPPKLVMHKVFIPARRLVCVEDEEERIECVYASAGGFRKAQMDRRALRETRRLIAESPPDVHVTSINGGAVVRWVDDCLAVNDLRLPTAKFVRQGGWQRHDPACFMLDRPYGGDGDSEPDTSGSRGDMIRALGTKGTMHAQEAALREAFATDDIAALTIIASLAAPLLSKLPAPNFALNLYGDSSRGKTSMARIGASIYGNPRSEHLFASWNTTAVALELRCLAYCDLPNFMDEIGSMQDRFKLAQSVYMVVNGVGRARGDKTLTLKPTPEWRTVLISTGERELVTSEDPTGAQVRVIQMRVRGFGAAGAADVDRMREACEVNYGHVGRAWIEHLTGLESEAFGSARELFRDTVRGMREKARGPLEKRQATFFAAMAVAESVAFTLGIGCRADGGTVKRVFEAYLAGAQVPKSAGDRGLDVVAEWMASEPASFPEMVLAQGQRHKVPKETRAREIYGYREEREVWLLGEPLRSRLEASGLSVSECTQAWAETGCLVPDGKRMVARRRVGGQRLRVFVLAAEALGMDVPELDPSCEPEGVF